ncbi:hypothetical protein HDIA_4520 [Hartmannibacter diazotrophicus]|uniref:SURF1-like protein n=1 Tax=Hartmannibacter diazotrophicus TaxID=1482074 RepID=A0A2C9DE44_9HYPH|nr:SURF1 family protein [Hartmannibacter diazotrophicus]SON58061.1 hypothetical protein HDIA_4520 [Hartmannibacter diazotrophicus]
MTNPMPAGKARSRRILFVAGTAVLVLVLLALGTWQVERRAWKLDLIARVESRIHADPVEAPGTAAWPSIDAATSEYRHVTLSGTYLSGKDTLVKAVTDFGSGRWVLTPLKRNDGTVVLINRGFVADDQLSGKGWTAAEDGGPVTVTGLLRISEPGGGFLRDNDPGADRWYSRDVAAIASAKGLDALGAVAPYFVDQDAAAGAIADGSSRPIAGLTRVTFANNHLTYAITWYGLALMVAAGTVYGLGKERD